MNYAKELMWGNYLLKDNQIVEVQNIFAASGLIDIKGLEDGIVHNRQSIVLQLRPIKITCEWLVKLGFEERKTLSFDPIIYSKGAFTLFDKVMRINYKGTALTHCKYIHQLQNIYFGMNGEYLIIEK